MGLRPEVRAHYELDAVERDRLTGGHGVLEFLRTQELLSRFLPLVELTARMLSTLLPPWPEGQPAVLSATGPLQEWPR